MDRACVRYFAQREQVLSLKEYTIRRLKRRVDLVDVWALKRVTFAVKRGELLGVIGANGAGKSSLLKLTAQVLRPTGGRVRVRGSVAPLLELGAAFHPELTGRENVYLYGTLLGRTHTAIQQAFEDIVVFAGLEASIDSPLRTYSSGMIGRLAFSVATHWQPDVLLVDEALSVGDLAFAEQCRRRLDGFREAGVTVLLVSHDLNLVGELCDRALWLAHGEVAALGDPAETIERYRSALLA